jgi:PAS domain S-box-containing protein
VPVLRNGLTVAILGIGNKPTDYDEHDAASIHALADLAWEIVDAKRTELELRESEARLQLITDSAHDGIIMIDDQGKVSFWNPAAEQILGYRREEAIGKDIHALLAPERFLPLARKAFPAFAAAGQGNAVGKTLELAARHKNGQEISISLSLSAVSVHDHWHAVGVMHDITERKKMEEALRKSEEEYRTLFREMLDGFALHQILCDGAGKPVDYRFLNVNPAFERLTGLLGRDIIGKTVLELMPETESHWIETYGQVALTGKPVFFEHYSSQIGKHFEVSAFSPQPGCFACIFADVTERKMAEAARRESENRLEHLLLHLPAGVVVHGPDTSVLLANREASRLLGLSMEQMQGKLAIDPYWQLVGEDGTPLTVDNYPVSRAIATGRALESRIIGVDRPTTGDRVWILISAFPEFDSESRLHQVVVTFVDITERKLAEAEQEKLRGQLMQAQKMESVGQLAGGVAHDFNNMLHAILGYTELVASQLDPAHPLHTELGEIKNAAGRAAELTRQLLAFARKQTSMPRPLDLNTVVNETLAMLRRLVGETIHLLWKPGPGLWTVLADPTQVGMVLTNLCVNARDAIGGEGHITVETRNARLDDAHPASRPGEYVVLAVADDGCGMTREVLDRVFDPFFTTKEVGKGTGLGLASVHGIAEQNGGFVQVASEPGKGTVFEIFLPRHHAGDGEPGSGPAPVPAALPRGTETILVAEDEAIILSVCRALLTKLGYRVLAARTPTEAIAICREHDGPIHLLLTDVVMPEMNGRRLVALARELRPDIPCLYMSGYTAGAIAQRDVIEEGLDFLQKPFSNRQLAEKVRQILDRSGNPKPTESP